METGLDLRTTTVTIFGDFFGPNFVRGLAEQSGSYTVINENFAYLVFDGGVDPDITLVQVVQGTNFSFDETTGRYTGTVTNYWGFELDDPSNGWEFTNLDTSLDALNSNASDPDVTFQDLLTVPLQYNFVGADGQDFYILGSFNDIAHGNDNNDTFIGLTGDDMLYGDNGNDNLAGDEGQDYLSGGNGIDAMDGGDDDDTMDGDNGDDLMYGGQGADTMNGGNDNDIMDGGYGNDLIHGDDGNDTLYGDTGSDEVYGDTGDDAIHGGDEGDFLYGGDGNDQLWGDDGADFVFGGLGDDYIRGGNDANILYGDEGNDTLAGNTASDQLIGGTGNDVLKAGASPDYLEGGLGDDILSGNKSDGSGDKTSDIFIFEANFGRDYITDFEVGFDLVIFTLGISSTDVTATTIGDDVLLEVDFAGGQYLLLADVADTFDSNIDILYQDVVSF